MLKIVSLLTVGLALFSLSAAEETPEAKPTSDLAIAESLAGNLIKATGGKAEEYTVKGSPKFYVLYHSASWCGVCKLVTPKVIDAYKAISKKSNPAVEVILMNYDDSQEEMTKYMVDSKINFPGLKQEQTRTHVLGKVHDTTALPTLVMIDSKGTVITTDQEEVLTKLSELAK